MTGSGPAKILVVDDEAMVLRSLGRYLSRELQVTCLTDARAALRLLEDGERFRLILCDLMMPDVTGADFHAELLARFPEYAGRVLMMTGGASTPEARAFLETSGVPYVEKPIGLEALKARILAMLAGEAPGPG